MNPCTNTSPDLPAWAADAGLDTRAYKAMTPEQRRDARRVARHGTERERIADVLQRYRRAEWDAQSMPAHEKHAGPSPLREAPAPKPRTRARGTYTRELVRATTRGHDHVPERPRPEDVHGVPGSFWCDAFCVEWVLSK